MHGKANSNNLCAPLIREVLEQAIEAGTNGGKRGIDRPQGGESKLGPKGSYARAVYVRPQVIPMAA
jgi:hypothetical protein